MCKFPRDRCEEAERGHPPVEADPSEDLHKYDEDAGSNVAPEHAAVGAQRELDFMRQLNFGAAVKRSEVSEGSRVWSARWCFQRKPDMSEGGHNTLCATAAPLSKQKRSQKHRDWIAASPHRHCIAHEARLDIRNLQCDTQVHADG